MATDVPPSQLDSRLRPDPPLAPLMIRARGLRKSYGTLDAVTGIDVDVRRGEAFGFLGPIGAGKSSAMRMIAAVSPVSHGFLTVLGMDPAESSERPLTCWRSCSSPRRPAPAWRTCPAA